MNEYQTLTLALAVLSCTSWIVTMISLRRHHRFAPLLSIFSGVAGLAFFSMIPSFFATGALLSLMAMVFGASLFFTRPSASGAVTRTAVPAVAARSLQRELPQYRRPEEPLSESGIWRLRHS
ncbi:MAG TPA: hypothetical protein VNM92_04350 [Thermoanaerobaculia bacterium]|nr:hypothetical protein [Thermoanaerobaculia bacterium]